MSEQTYAQRELAFRVWTEILDRLGSYVMEVRRA